MCPLGRVCEYIHTKFTVTVGFPSQTVSSSEGVSILWRHHVYVHIEWRFLSNNGGGGGGGGEERNHPIGFALRALSGAKKGGFHSTMTSSNGKLFALLALCAGNSPITGEFPSQRPMTQSFDVFFDLYLNKRLSKQSRSTHYDVTAMHISFAFMMTSSKENIFRVTGHLCGVAGESPTQRPVTRGFDVFFDLCLNKRLSKQSWGWWFETPSRRLWHHCNVTAALWWWILKVYPGLKIRRHGSCIFTIDIYEHIF